MALSYAVSAALIAAVGLAPAAPRVISLHDVTTEIVVALGAVPRLVGVAGAVDQAPATIAAVAKVPRAEGTESIVALAPTLLLGMHTVGERSPDLVQLLRARGTEVLLGDPHTLDDVFALVLAIAARLDARAAGAKLVAELRARAPAPGTGRGSVPVFVYDCCDPAFTAGGRAVLTDLIARAGGRNVFADLDTRWGKVPWESVVARRPALIVIDDYAFTGQSDVAGKRAQLARIPSLARIPTVVMPLGEALGGLRSVDGLARLRAAIAAVAAPGPPDKAGRPSVEPASPLPLRKTGEGDRSSPERRATGIVRPLQSSGEGRGEAGPTSGRGEPRP